MSAGTESAVREFLGLLFEPGDVFEVRAPDCRDRPDARWSYVSSGCFSVENVDAAAKAIVELDRAAFAPAVYVTMNPITPALLARSANRISFRARATTQDRDIVRRRWLLIDVDPVRPAGISATDAELAAAAERARAVDAHLHSLGWSAPVTILSGNGYHLLYRVDLPVDDDGLVRRVLNALAERFDDAAVAIDRSVHNPARIIKVVGTMARKGEDLRGVAGLDDRPHRRAELVDVPADITVVPRELLEQFAPAPAASPPVAAAPGRIEHTPAGVRAWLAAHGVVVRDERRNGDKTLLLLERCPINSEIVSTGGSDIAVLVGDDGKLAYCNKHSRGEHYTWHDLRTALEPGYVPAITADSGVDLSAFGTPAPPADADRSDRAPPPDPGPLPEELLRVPGFVGEVMDHCLETAPYPNLVMAFCGAIALQAFLAARKVRDPGDNRTNLYLLGLARSSAGKDWPRKLNTRILHEVGLADGLGERFASGEGIQDALFAEPAMLFQTDEIDGMLQSINKARDARHESIMSTLLTMYSSANSVFPMRRRADKASPGVIDQPCLVLFGTAIPNHYYQALSDRMLTNGFFARMLILESGPRSEGQEPSIRALPPRVRSTAHWWAQYRPGTGNLQNWHPAPAIVEHTDAARAVLVEARREAEAEYAAAERRDDDVGTTVWGRVNEQVRKLALLHAISTDHKAPRIEQAAAEWARRFVMHLTRRMLHMAFDHVAANEFDDACKQLLRVLTAWRDKHGDLPMPTWRIKRALKMPPSTFRDVASELVDRQEIHYMQIATQGRPREGFVVL